MACLWLMASRCTYTLLHELVCMRSPYRLFHAAFRRCAIHSVLLCQGSFNTGIRVALGFQLGSQPLTFFPRNPPYHGACHGICAVFSSAPNFLVWSVAQHSGTGARLWARQTRRVS